MNERPAGVTTAGAAAVGDNGGCGLWMFKDSLREPRMADSRGVVGLLAHT